MLNKWHSEKWGDSLSLVGAVIGWTRGTALMEKQNLLAESFEQMGVRTFSTIEMAFCLLALLTRSICRKAQQCPVMADLGGNLLAVKDLSQRLQGLRKTMDETAETRHTIARDAKEDALLLSDPKAAPVKRATVQPRANNTFEYPELPAWSELGDIRKNLQGLVDLERVVVITGYGEVGPWGSAR